MKRLKSVVLNELNAIDFLKAKNLDDPLRNENEKECRFYECYKHGILSKDRKYIYYIGIIDILTNYTTRKKWEHNLKRIF